MSCYVFAAGDLLMASAELRADNAQKSIILPTARAICGGAGRVVEALPVLTPPETLSINTVDELAIVEATLQAE